MRPPANTKRAVVLVPWILLAAATSGVYADGPADAAPATACLQLQTRPAVPGTPGCLRFVTLQNSCDVPVLAEVRRTQHLFSGTLSESFPVVVAPGGEQALDCAWWSGATTPTQHELVAARYLAAPHRHGDRNHGESNRR
jgi:hypothetical protein